MDLFDVNPKATARRAMIALAIEIGTNPRWQQHSVYLPHVQANCRLAGLPEVGSSWDRWIVNIRAALLAERAA
jgi:hypothetical protein